MVIDSSVHLQKHCAYLYQGRAHAGVHAHSLPRVPEAVDGSSLLPKLGGGHRHPEACHPIPEEQFCPRTCPSPPISSMLVSWLKGSRKFHSILVNEVSGQEGGEANFFHQVAGSSFCRPPDTRRDNYIKYHLRGQCSDCMSGQIPWSMAGSCKGVGVLSMPAST